MEKAKALTVMDKDRSCNITPLEREQTSIRSFFAKEFTEFLEGEKQMNGKPCASPHKVKDWSNIDFKSAEYNVKKLQMRIAKAVKEGKHNKAKALQWMRRICKMGIGGRHQRLLR